MATTTSHGAMPDGLPLLVRGRHADPDEGSCLMEYVSVLAGGRFSDHPRCTHPLLTWAARRINDTVSDTARPQLATIAPDLIGTRVHRRRTRKAVRAVIYAELAAIGLVADPHHRVLHELHELALAHLTGRRWLRPVGTFDRNHVFETTLQALGDVEPARRDQLLCTALASSVARSRRVLGLDNHSGPPGGVGRGDQHRAVCA
jgi:hypothetical protein